MGGTIYDEDVFKQIALLKKTPLEKPVSILFSSTLQLKEFFTFPEEFSFTDDFLEIFFSLESTWCLPLSWMKGFPSAPVIPSWIYQSETSVGVRVLDFPWIKEIIAEIQAPLITTSLNLTGEAPINSLKEAQEFKNIWAPQAQIIESIFQGDENFISSGQSSTIVSFDQSKNQLRFIREGQYAPEISALFNQRDVNAI